MSDMRKLGNTDMKVVPVGLGCMGFSHAYGAPTQKQEAVRMIRKAFDIPAEDKERLKELGEMILAPAA